MNLMDKPTLTEVEAVARYYKGALDNTIAWGSENPDWALDPYLFPLAERAARQLGIGRGPILMELGRWDGVVREQLAYPGGLAYQLTLEEVLRMYCKLIEIHYERLEAEEDARS